MMMKIHINKICQYKVAIVMRAISVHDQKASYLLSSDC